MLFSTLLLQVLWYLLLSYGTRFWQAYVNPLMGGGSTEYMDVDWRLRAGKFCLRSQKQLAELGILYLIES
jgi:hypothetical protein